MSKEAWAEVEYALLKVYMAIKRKGTTLAIPCYTVRHTLLSKLGYKGHNRRQTTISVWSRSTGLNAGRSHHQGKQGGLWNRSGSFGVSCSTQLWSLLTLVVITKTFWRVRLRRELLITHLEIESNVKYRKPWEAMDVRSGRWSVVMRLEQRHSKELKWLATDSQYLNSGQDCPLQKEHSDFERSKESRATYFIVISES